MLGGAAKNSAVNVEEALTDSGTNTGSGARAKEPPLSVSVAQAFFVGEKLQVKVRVEAKTTLPTDEVVLSVVGLKEGQVVETHDIALNQVLHTASIYSGQSALASFELESQDLSEYQLQCRWGADAVQQLSKNIAAAPKQTAAESVEPPQQTTAAAEPALNPEQAIAPPELAQRASLAAQPGRLELQNVELDEESSACAKPPCDKYYTLHARVVNQSAEALREVTLGVGLAWAEGNNLPRPPADYSEKQAREEAVALKGVVMKPGDGKKLKIKINRPVPFVPGGSFYPYIRIVSADKAGL